MQRAEGISQAAISRQEWKKEKKGGERNHDAREGSESREACVKGLQTMQAYGYGRSDVTVSTGC